MEIENQIKKYYDKYEVRENISKFCKSRWIALHCQKDKLILRRYFKNSKVPLNIEGNSIENILQENCIGVTRSVYASANLYKKIQSLKDVEEASNIIACTPTFDVDSSIANWRKTIEIVKEIISILNKYKVEKSIIVKWSGEGCHVHINEKAIPFENYKKYHPLDIAYRIVEFISRKVTDEIFQRNLGFGQVRVENKMDLKRIFTAPLSLHRKLFTACICINLNEIDNFDISWVNPFKYKHHNGWDYFEDNEASYLVDASIRNITSSYFFKYKRKYPPLDEHIRKYLDQN